MAAFDISYQGQQTHHEPESDGSAQSFDQEHPTGPASGDVQPGPEQRALVEQESPAPPKKTKKSKKRKRQLQQPEAQIEHRQAFPPNQNDFNSPVKGGHPSHLQDVSGEHYDHHPSARGPAEHNDTIFISSPQRQTSELSSTGPETFYGPEPSTKEPSPAKYAYQIQVAYQQPQAVLSKYRPRPLLDTSKTELIDQPAITSTQGNASQYPIQVASPAPAQGPVYAVEQRMSDRQPLREQSVNDQQSSGLDMVFEQLRRTIENRTAQEIQQLTAENQSLATQLQHSITAKDALQDHVSSLRDEKERFAVSLEQEKEKFQDVKSRALQCRKFINSLQGDMAKIKSDADREHKQMQQLLAATNTPAPDMTEHIENSKRLKNEVAKQCQAASFKVSLAESRIILLEEDLKQKIGSLAEEKNLREQLQAQLNTIEGTKKAMLEQISRGKNEVLDKLYEIHATLEENENREGLTNMLQTTMTAIQDLNNKPETAIDEITSIKSMMESLTENVSHFTNDRQSEHGEKLIALQSKINELEVELQAKIAEVTSLQEKVDAASTNAAPVSDEQVEAIRRDAMAFQAQRQAEMENEMKKMRSRPSKDEFMNIKEQAAHSKRLADSLQQDVNNLNQQVEHAKRMAWTAENEGRELQKKVVAGASAEQLVSIKKQRAEAESLASRRLQEIEKLNQLFENEQRQTATVQRIAESRQQKIHELNQQITNQQRISEQKLAALPSAEDQASKQEQHLAAHELVEEKQKTINAINTQLEQEKEKCRNLQSTNEQYKTSCDSAIAEEKQRCEHNIKALQTEVEQARNELQIHMAENDKIRADIGQRRKKEGAKIYELEKQRNDLRQEREDLLRQVAELKQAAVTQPEPGNQRIAAQESQQDEPRANPSDPRHPRPLYAQETQGAYEYIEESRFTPNVSDKDTKYKKVKQASNSSSKRVSTPSIQSSSPGFVNFQAGKPTTYGANSSGQKRRSSQVTEPVKRKASNGGRIVDGYEVERHKRVKPNGFGRAEYRPSRPSAPPSVPDSSYGSRTRVTRSGAAQINHRFAQELSKDQNGGGRRR